MSEINYLTLNAIQKCVYSVQAKQQKYRFPQQFRVFNC